MSRAANIAHIINTENPTAQLCSSAVAAIKLTQTLHSLGVKFLAPALRMLMRLEDREKFDKILEQCGIPRPAGKTVFTRRGACCCKMLNYPRFGAPVLCAWRSGHGNSFNDYDIIDL